MENDRAVVRISDTGTGMTEEVRQRLSRALFSTKNDKGTGLGLAMVYGIVQRHNGVLELDSFLGTGRLSLFGFPLPSQSRTKAPALPVDPTIKSPLHVLVVDDEPGIREVISAFLRSDGHDVITAADGREGLKEFQTRVF